MENWQDQRFLAFDVETPNRHNDRMSSIGFSVLEHGEIVEEHATLLDPQTWFDTFNSQLTGIWPDSVLGYPAFPEVWKLIEPLFSGSILVAHNAPFDLSVLAKCLRDYHIDWKPSVLYTCTVRMSRYCFPEIPNHSLDTVSQYLNIDLQHHLAMSDAHACAEIFQSCLWSGVDLARFLRRYDLGALRTDPHWRP